MENVVIFYDNLEYFMAIWHNACQFGIVCGHLVFVFPFWYVKTKKNLATMLKRVFFSIFGRVAVSHDCLV
jgi:ABC-type spermidine/putrescine transport system permease subunit II